MPSFEWPFVLAIVMARRESPKWAGPLTFLLPALCFDVLDNQFAGCLTHTLIFISIRRFKSVFDFSGFPANVLIGIGIAMLDRMLYGLLVGLKFGAGASLMFRSILDPSYVLTLLFLPVVLAITRD